MLGNTLRTTNRIIIVIALLAEALIRGTLAVITSPALAFSWPERMPSFFIATAQDNLESAQMVASVLKHSFFKSISS